MSGAPIPYKCIVCGEIEHATPDRPGLACRICGSRIFSKPRNKGHKILDANQMDPIFDEPLTINPYGEHD